MPTPTKAAARNGLETFLPKSGRDYSAGRNYDYGPNNESTVSRLSPWIRIRQLPEWEVMTAVLEHHSATAASKFIDEICWRTYWKGWLQLRPSVWQDYLDDRCQLLEEYSGHIGYQMAIQGRTGIDCFDAWADELVATNYLHNHARMWFASIWTHTLQLPWQLGADWFMRHLLDGDPASNTLGWRWVGGLHTSGKTYLARPENIRKFSNGRFQVNAKLASAPFNLGEATLPKPKSLPQINPVARGQRLGLVVTEEDLSAGDWIEHEYPIATTALYFPRSDYENLEISSKVADFRYRALLKTDGIATFEDIRSLIDWAKEKHLGGIVMAEPTTGHWPEIAKTLRSELENAAIGLYTVRHWWDETLFPHATHGFFRFKKAIPQALSQLSRSNF